MVLITIMASRSDRRSVKPISCMAHASEALETNGSLRADFMMAREVKLLPTDEAGCTTATDSASLVAVNP